MEYKVQRRKDCVQFAEKGPYSRRVSKAFRSLLRGGLNRGSRST